MRNCLTGIAVLALSSQLALGSAWAEEGSFNWNPFAQEASSPARARVGDEPSRSGWGWPKWSMPELPTFQPPRVPLPSTQSETARRAQQGRRGPSTWEKMNRGTARFFTATKETLMPWTVDRPEKPPSRMRMASRRSGQKDSSIFRWPSFFKPAEPPKPPGSVKEFLKQPRP